MAHPSRVDEETLRTLVAQGLHPGEIGQRMGFGRSTIVDRMKALGLTPQPAAPRPPQARSGVSPRPPVVSTGLPADMASDLQEMVEWWRERRVALQGRAEDSTTQRMTYHVEPRWIEAIRRMADLEGLSITQAVNQALRGYFTRKYT